MISFLLPLQQVLEAAGCVHQERLGWERPGWFAAAPTPVADYDWYAAYGNERSKDQRYNDALKMDYTFDWPANHHLVMIKANKYLQP